MSLRVSATWFLACLAISTSAAAMHAQTGPPTVYTVVENFDIMGPKSVVKTYRNGSKALVEAKTDTMHTRAIFDFDKHQSVSWDQDNPTAPCGRSEIGADWGDPFSQPSSNEDDLKKSNAKQEPSETLLGIEAEVWSTSSPQSDAKIWIDKAHSLLLKYQVTEKPSPARTMIEVTQLSFAPPPMSLFVEPARCASAAPPVHVPTNAEQIAAETGDDAANYVAGTYGPGSKESCSVSLRVVAAKTMQPVALPYQIGIDLTYDPQQNPPPHYTTGLSNDGHSTFSGAGMHELTLQVRNGVLHIDNFPPQVYLEMIFHDGGGPSGLVYRHYFGPHTELLYVMKDPAHDNDVGEFLWVKSGKYATLPQ